MLRIDTKTGRNALEARREPYWRRIARDQHVGFRKLEDGPGTWIARYRGEDGKRQYKALGDFADVPDPERYDRAAAAAQAWFRDLDRGVMGKGETVADACKAYVADRKSQKGEAAERAAKQTFERTVYGGGGKGGDRYKPHPIASTPLAKIRRKAIEQWRDGLLERGLSKSSANRTLTTLRAALNLAVRDRHVSVDTAIEWRSVKPFVNAGKRRELYLDLAQRRALLEHAKGSVRDLIEAAALTGARAGELVSARRSAFDARTKSLTLTGKTGSRTIPLSTKAVELFTRLAESKLPSAYLLTQDDGRPWGHSGWDELVRDAAAAAKLPPGTCIYTLRHSWISTALLEGLATLEVARIAGTSLKMIEKHYGHLADKAARERLAKVQLL